MRDSACRAHRVEYPRHKEPGSFGTMTPGVEIRGKPNGRTDTGRRRGGGGGGGGLRGGGRRKSWGKQARTFPVTLRYKESNPSGEIHVNVNAGSAVR